MPIYYNKDLSYHFRISFSKVLIILEQLSRYNDKDPILQSHDVDAEFHDVGRRPAEPAHDEQHVIVVDGRWDGPDGYDRGHDGGP